MFIVYEEDTWSRDLNTDFTLSDCLLGAVKLTKNTDLNKYGYSGYATGFDVHSQISQFYCQMVNGVKILLFLELITVFLCMFIIEKKISL